MHHALRACEALFARTTVERELYFCTECSRRTVFTQDSRHITRGAML